MPGALNAAGGRRERGDERVPRAVDKGHEGVDVGGRGARAAGGRQRAQVLEDEAGATRLGVPPGVLAAAEAVADGLAVRPPALRGIPLARGHGERELARVEAVGTRRWRPRAGRVKGMDRITEPSARVMGAAWTRASQKPVTHVAEGGG